MVEFRTNTGLVSCTPYMRTNAGLVECEPLFFGENGAIDTGSAAPLSASASPDTVFGAISQKTTSPVTTNQTSVTVTGGTPPYSYAWSTLTPWTVVNPTADTTAFRRTVPSDGTFDAAFACTVTDARGATAITNDVNASVGNFWTA